jgi:hypothetical protein
MKISSPSLILCHEPDSSSHAHHHHITSSPPHDPLFSKKNGKNNLQHFSSLLLDPLFSISGGGFQF